MVIGRGRTAEILAWDGSRAMKLYLERAIEWAEGSLPERIRRRIRERLDELPDEERVCHGDFHPDNVLLGEGGPVIIDWGPASAGHPLADDIPEESSRLIALIEREFADRG
jgi:Ser/Thr protein kinase RdoA (MazF antagonist)